jgi:predicted Zn-dependent peptidase
MNTTILERVWSRRVLPILVPIPAGALLPASPLFAGRIVDHPDKLKYEELEYDPPDPADYRYTLDCGATAYVAENHEVPTFELTILVRTGSMYEPVEKAGLADMTGYLMRNGGTRALTARELDERIAFLAGDISVDIGESRGTVELFCLSKDIDEGLELLRGVLREPVFDPDALDRYRADVLSELKQRNNDSASIEAREWRFLLYGDHPSTTAWRRTARSIGSITREDLVAFHERYFFPGNFTFAVAGDFETGEILAKLNALLAGWPDRPLDPPEIPDRIPDPEPGVYMIDKADVNQSRIRIGHIGVKRDIPDEYALMIMNDILGGGGFTSRLVRRVRSDEGLAYSVRSAFIRPVLYPGPFQAAFQTKHPTAAYGTKIILEEIERIRTEAPDPEAVENAKAKFIGNLVNPFNSRKTIVNTFASDDFTGRPDDYWARYEENIAAVTPDDVLAAARKYLHPDRLVILVVGSVEAVREGWDKDPARFEDFGPVTVLPLRDPLTLEAP